ncbi:Uu.00g115310.m01.CDS01 [Anthostomella pinea]|uniref:Uu.00g115310.m01.CDS01 n=1 Tax=Anthostomella pinea TaxID=933095 RepID=A0AAI8VFW0_9PEZI|nr:Uu.00g115310.m01.CDS01 [Anthostomella pinea]
MLASDVLHPALGYAGYLFLTYILRLLGYRLLLHPLRDYPGPFLAKLTGLHAGFYAVRRRLHLEIYRNHVQYGPVVRVGPDRLVFNSVTALHDIYQSERITESRGYVTTARNNVFNVFNALDRDLHRQKRRLVGLAVSERSMRAFEPTLMSHVDICLSQMLESSRNSSSVDMTAKARHPGLDIVGQLAFGYDLRIQTSEENRFMMKAMTFGNYRGNVYQHLHWRSKLYPTPILDKVFYEAREKYYPLLETMISTRVAQDKHAKHDLFSFVAESVKSTDRGGDLWQEALFFILAAGDTTATAICAAFFYMSRNPECYKKLASEIRSAFETGLDIKSGPQLAGCRYLRACIDESMRMSPPVGTTLREQDSRDGETQPLIVDGHVIPRGTLVGVNIYALHHNPEYFPDPFTFSPEPWIIPWSEGAAGEKARKLMHDAFAAFSVGTRGCAGKAMAYLGGLSGGWVLEAWLAPFQEQTRRLICILDYCSSQTCGATI